SWEDVAGRSRRMAALLHKRGLRTGHRLCVYLVNRVEMIDLYLACLSLGVIFVPINILYKEREVSHILRDAEPEAVIVDGDLPAAAPNVWQVSDLVVDDDALPAVALDGDDA